MLLKKYTKFHNEFLNENVDAAKTFMKNFYLKKKKEKEPGTPEKPTGLSPEEQKAAINDPDFIKVKNMLAQNAGWTFLFTRFHFQNGAPMDALKDLYDLLKQHSKTLDLLPIDPATGKPLELLKYPNLSPEDEQRIYQDGLTKGGYERLSDDLVQVDRKKKAKKFTDELTGKLKEEYQEANTVVQKQIIDIGVSFAELGQNPDGSIDKKMNHDLQRLFWSKIKDDKSLRDLVKRAQNHIKASNNGSAGKFLQAIYDVNQKLGESHGAEIIYNENDILIIEIKSYQANSRLNANTAHCIARTQGYWDSYCGSDDLYNKQYYIYNWGLPPNNNDSVIGITIEPKQRIRACHRKNDGGVSDSEIKSYMKKINVPFSILEPMSDEDIAAKKRRVKASKEIIKPGLSTEDCKRYYEDGADPNTKNAIALDNAVKEDNYEKTKFLLSVGANPNLGMSIKYAKNFNMVKLLVDYESNLTVEVINNIINEYDAMEYVLKTGVDPNFENGYPLRMAAAKNANMDIVKLLIANNAKINTRRYMVLKWTVEWGRAEMLDYLFTLLKKEDDPILKDGPMKERAFRDWLNWLNNSDKVKQAEKDAAKEVLIKWRDMK